MALSAFIRVKKISLVLERFTPVRLVYCVTVQRGVPRLHEKPFMVIGHSALEDLGVSRMGIIMISYLSMLLDS